MKKMWKPLLAVALVMFGLPWAAVTFAPGDAGMAICFLLFFGMNPLCSLFVGIWSGLRGKERWYWSALNAAVFLLSVWTLFDRGEPAFVGYAIAYLAVGVFTMVVTIFVLRIIRQNAVGTE